MAREAVVVEAVRTAVGKRGGGLSNEHADDRSADVLRTLAAGWPESIPYTTMTGPIPATEKLLKRSGVALGHPLGASGATLLELVAA